MKLYRDKSELFTCDLEIEGASINKSEARLVLRFDTGEIRLYEGSLADDGRCDVDIPALTDGRAKRGKAVLEIIADGSYFCPWESNFEVESSKKVSVTEVRLSNQTETPKVSTKKTEKPKKKVISKAIPKVNLTESIKKHGLKTDVSNETVYMIGELWKAYENLPMSDKTKTKIMAEEVVIPKIIEKWASSTFENTKSKNAKICMYLMSESIKK
jgi:hypothetical protein